jgi:hypothetical protein
LQAINSISEIISMILECFYRVTDQVWETVKPCLILSFENSTTTANERWEEDDAASIIHPNLAKVGD